MKDVADLAKLQVENSRLKFLLNEKCQELSKSQKALSNKESELQSLKIQLKWLKTQLFGAKSERRVIDSSNSRQLPLGFPLETPELPPAPSVTIKSYERNQRKEGKVELTEANCRLKFSKDVPVEVIELENPATIGLAEDEYEVIGTREKYQLCVKPSQYFVKRYVQPVVKLSGEIKNPPAISQVIEKSYADVTFLAHLLVEKFQYHLPLYRQHQRMERDGIFVARSSLSRLVHRASQLLEPLHKALLSSVLSSSVIAIDETTLKVGTTPKGKMHQGYLVPMYGLNDEVVFHYSPTRRLDVVTTILKDFKGTILTDGYHYYESLAGEQMTHALCWAHARREFKNAESLEPKLVAEVLEYIGKLYEIEEHCRGKPPSEILAIRQEHSLPLVNTLFNYYLEKRNSMALVPSNQFGKALNYSLKRESGLRVFLNNSLVALDTNHLEREIRPTAIGRKNWLFCMNDIGASAVAIVSSLVRTCVLNQVDPFEYFCDVLLRIDSHPAARVHELTPREWKDRFSG